jgi:alpha-tubulin suppressor-like RCC1 family protein
MPNPLKLMMATAGVAGADGGGLFHMGRGTSGLSGNNDSTNHTSPVQVGTETDWTDVNSLMYSVVAIREGSTMWGWGQGSYGKIGLGNTTNYSSPVQIGSLTTWARLGQGRSQHSIAIKTDGTIWAFGNNSAGQLGTGNTTSLSSPVQIGSLTNWSYDAGKVATTYQGTVAIKKDGTMWSWGRNHKGQLGHGDTTYLCSPVQIGALTTWSSVSAGRFSFTALKTDGTLWSWGDNDNGQLGINVAGTTDKSSPTQIGGLTTWTSINRTFQGGQAVKSDGKLWTWGRAYWGTLGNGTTTPDKSSPIQVGALTDWSSAVAGSAQAAFALKDGAAWAWGDNGQGKLGLGDSTSRSSPVQIGSLTTWIFISGSYATFGIQTA